MRGFVQIEGVVHIASRWILREYGKIFVLFDFDLLMNVLLGNVLLTNVLLRSGD